MNQFPESTFDTAPDEPGFFGLLGIAFGLVVAGVSLAVLIAGA